MILLQLTTSLPPGGRAQTPFSVALACLHVCQLITPSVTLVGVPNKAPHQSDTHHCVSKKQQAALLLSPRVPTANGHPLWPADRVLHRVMLLEKPSATQTNTNLPRYSATLLLAPNQAMRVNSCNTVILHQCCIPQVRVIRGIMTKQHAVQPENRRHEVKSHLLVDRASMTWLLHTLLLQCCVRLLESFLTPTWCRRPTPITAVKQVMPSPLKTILQTVLPA